MAKSHLRSGSGSVSSPYPARERRGNVPVRPINLGSRGLTRGQLVISDDHRGLTKAIDALLPGAG